MREKSALTAQDLLTPEERAEREKQHKMRLILQSIQGRFSHGGALATARAMVEGEERAKYRSPHDVQRTRGKRCRVRRQARREAQNRRQRGEQPRHGYSGRFKFAKL